MVNLRCGSDESGKSQLKQSPWPDNSAHAVDSESACAFWKSEVRRSESFSGSDLPSVASEIVWRARLIVTASRDGSSASASTTDRAKHFGEAALAGSLAGGTELISAFFAGEISLDSGGMTRVVYGYSIRDNACSVCK